MNPARDLWDVEGLVAVAFGSYGATVRSADHLRAALRDDIAQPALTVIELRTTRRVLSLPCRRLRYGKEV